MSHAINYKNRLIVHRAIQKITVALFYRPRCSTSSSSSSCCCCCCCSSWSV